MARSPMARDLIDLAAGLLGTASRRLAWLELAACKALIALFTILLIVNVSLRYGFNAPLFFAEELAVYVLIWMAFLAISVSIHEDAQVRLTLLTDALPAPLRRPIRLLTELVVAVMLAVLLVHAVGWIRSPAVEFELAITLGLPKAPFFAIIPFFLAAALLHVGARLLAELAGLPAANAETAS